MDDGDIFLGDSESNRRVADAAAKSPQLSVLDVVDGLVFLGDFFTTGKSDHLMKYQQFMEKRFRSQAHLVFIADFSQNPDARNRSSYLIPTVTRSSCFASLSKG